MSTQCLEIKKTFMNKKNNMKEIQPNLNWSYVRLIIGIWKTTGKSADLMAKIVGANNGM